MKRVRGRKLAALMAIGVGVASAASCADNESTMFVRAVMAADDCSYEADPGEPTISHGVLDLAAATQYSAVLLVGNQLVPRGDPDQLRTETSRIVIYAADVQVLDANEAVLQRSDGSTAEFSVPTSGFIDPAAGTTPGWGLAAVPLIDAATSTNLGQAVQSTGFVQEIIASVILRGRTTGGNEVESTEFKFPVSVCVGCLALPSSSDDPANPDADCDALDVSDCPCAMGNDQPYDCCCAGIAACGG